MGHPPLNCDDALQSPYQILPLPEPLLHPESALTMY
ncbi:hypothetical protein EVA_20439 [gut metagenome]|uniref:Uncharacterized protein n=1 Tax=gut metagenome TaxID=749906 RepID=J9FVP1_9ZZZZ